ncbi:potassium channel subfamily K member 15 [Cimex lectularius]|uniref:Potassium channel domain-containing protein n=1 Tax=Cimex lectularius TaxID=79782 RepID=A0A8I6TLK9_CIMLE|nr:potassium channel subfamily K member 15 [Cimex lectularius]
MSSRHHGSVRSHASLSSVGSNHDPGFKIRRCCRKLITFMCTQVGVGGLIVGYSIVGAFTFISIEGKHERSEAEQVETLRRDCVEELWKLLNEENVFNKTRWLERASGIIKDFQFGFAQAVKKGYDERPSEEIWSFPAALMFCLSVFTMIGYGNLVPKTKSGKAATVVYAIFGIPLYVLYFMNMGQVLASAFKWFYTKCYRCSLELQREGNQPARVVVPPTACLWVLGAYIATGTIMFAEWENWDYLDSTYFCVTSLCKIGIGDFVPGANIHESESGHQTKLVINFIYLLIGMGLVAMCYNLMKEVIKVKMHDFRNRITICFEFLQLKAIDAYKRKQKTHGKRTRHSRN